MPDNGNPGPESPTDAPAPNNPEAPAPVRRTLLSEFCEYLMENKKWWMIPILLCVLLLGILLTTFATPVGVFLYTFF